MALQRFVLFGVLTVLGVFAHNMSAVLGFPVEDSWPSFLGAGREETANRDTRIPFEWSQSSNVAWQCKLPGYGQSSPVVWKDCAFVTCVDGPSKETLRVVSINTKSGNILWTHEQSTKNVGKNSDYIARGAPTAVIDSSMLIAFFEGGDLVALSHDGSPLWKKDLVREYGAIETNHGIASSLAQSDESVFVWVQRKTDPYLLAIEKKSGQVLWNVARPQGTAWSSPVLVPMPDGSTHLVLSMSGGSGERRGENRNEGAPNPPPSGLLTGLDPITGKELWKIEGLVGNSSQTPVIVEAGKLLIGASGGREGGPSKEAISTNGLVGIKKVEDRWVAEYIWRCTKASSGFCSPCYHRGLAYFTDRQGIVNCLDVNSGEPVYSERLGMSVWATPIGVGDRVYFVGETGRTDVLRSGPKFERLASNELWAEEELVPSEPKQGRANERRDERGMPITKARQYALAISGDTLLIRRGDILYGLREQ